MANINKESSRRISVDISVSGYLLTKEMLKQLCLLTYNATEAQIDNLGPIDFAILHYSKYHFLDAPWLVPMSYRSKTDPDVVEKGWLLTGNAVYFRPGTTPPKHTYDPETQAYLDTWLPR
ncbi:hypothetical protein C8Q74DRAFT_1372314 [Fomes fomentarius]|nr:hypothetical protein C8Q74DRAFT_1372314 [Fomes fomentarius]